MNTYYPNLINIVLVIVAILFWFWTQHLIGKKKLGTSDRVFDRLHIWSEPINVWLNNNPTYANMLLIFTSLVIDAIVLFLIGMAIFGSTFKTFIALVVVLLFRQICNFFSSLPIPSGIIWRYPGFPSLFVTYGVSNDFFFSGHTAIAMLGALQFLSSGHPFIIVIAFLVLVIQITSMIILRAHYTIDIFTAIFVAYVANLIAIQVAPGLDFWIHSLF